MRKSILVVDDNAGVRLAVRLTFEQDNRFEVCGEAVDGQDAIERARQLQPDLIVLDFSMPIMNGIEAARILRREMPAVPLILFTLHLMAAGESDAREAGFGAIVSKNQNIQLLVTQALMLLGLA